MIKTRYSARDLQGMTLKRLDAIGTEIGLTFGKNHSKAKRARMILDAYNELDLGAGSDDSPPSSQDPVTLGEAKPAFEQLIDGPSDGAADQDNEGPHRGGFRPGSGRPEGMTDELAAYNALSKQPHPVIKSLVEKLFDRWAAAVHCPEIKLTKDQAVALALPWTHAYELSPIGGKIPPWLSVAFMCLWSTWAIVDEKADLAREAAKRRTIVQAAAVPSVN